MKVLDVIVVVQLQWAIHEGDFGNNLALSHLVEVGII